MSAQHGIAFLHHIARTGNDGPRARFDTIALHGLTDIQAGEGHCSCRLAVGPAVCNRYDTLHGGCIATLVDVVGSAALYTVSPKGGVSLNINTNYLSPVPRGGEALIAAKVVKLGQTIAMVDVEIRDASSGRIVATGSHIKYIAPSSPPLEDLLTAEEKDALLRCLRKSGSGGSGGGGGDSQAEPQWPRPRL